MRSTIHWLALTFFFCTALAYAQDDLRVSAFEPPVYSFPTDIQIASAATVAGTTLVVWGTTTPGPDSAIGALVMQRIVGGAAVGVPEIVHASQARPFGVVSVIGLDDRFVVLWNDRRIGAPGIYLRRVGLDGALLGNEELMVPGKRLNSDKAVYLQRTSGGFQIVWCDTTGVRPPFPDNAYCFGQELDLAAGFVGGITRVQRINFDDTLEYSTFPGMRIVRRTDGSGLLYHQDGRLDDRTVSITRLNRPFYLDQDTSVVVMEGDTSGDRKIFFYHHLFDTVAYRAVPLPTQGLRPFQYAGAIGRDSVGRVVVIFGAVRLLDSDPTFQLVGPVLERGVIADADTLVELHTFDSAWGGLSLQTPSGYKTVQLTKEMTIAGDENSSTLITSFHNEEHNRDGTGGVGDGANQWVFNNHADSLFVMKLFPNDIRGRLNPIRHFDRTDRSQIAIFNGADTVVLAVGLVPLVPQVGRDRPIIIDRSEKLIIAWNRMVNVPTYELARIDRFDIGGTVPLRTLRPDPRGSWRDVRGVQEWWSNLTSTLSEGNGAVSVLASSDGGMKEQGGWQQVTWFAAYIALDTGWMRVTYRPYFYSFRYNNARVSYDPTTKHLAVSEIRWMSGGTVTTVYSIDTNGQAVWTKEGSTLPLGSSPVWPIGSDSSNYFLANQDSLYQVKMNNTKLAHVFPKGDPRSVRYYHLLGNGLLRVTPTDSLRTDGSLRDSTINLEMYGLNGQRSGLHTMRLPSANYRIAYAEHSSDTSIVFLWGADDGLHLTLLDKHLEPIIADSLLAARGDSLRNPSCLLRGDTLYAVWQDKRDGTNAIYANRWVLTNAFPHPPRNPLYPGDSAITKGPGIENLSIGSIRPNPALDHTRIRVEITDATPIQIDIVDVAGRLVRHEDRDGYVAGTWDIAIDLRDLHPGIYIIRLYTSHGETTTRIVVLH